MVAQRAPVQGPNTQVDSGLGFGPLPSGFIAGRIAPRVVFAGGIYIETGYGSSFEDVVQCLDGDVVGGPPDYAASTPDSDPPCTNLRASKPRRIVLRRRVFGGLFVSGA